MLINYPQAHQQLSAHAIHHFSETEFNKNIECLVQNSMAIAHTSKDHYRSEIMRLCTEVWCVCVLQVISITPSILINFRSSTSRMSCMLL